MAEWSLAGLFDWLRHKFGAVGRCRCTSCSVPKIVPGKSWSIPAAPGVYKLVDDMGRAYLVVERTSDGVAMIQGFPAEAAEAVGPKKWRDSQGIMNNAPPSKLPPGPGKGRVR